MRDPALATLILDAVARLKEPLHLDRWAINFESGEINEGNGARAACTADPEYREAIVYFDFDRIKTGDDLDEMVTHELTHCHTWPLHTLAESLADAVAETLPENAREPMRKLLQEQVRRAAEQVTTDVSQTYLRLLRRAGILAAP